MTFQAEPLERKQPFLSNNPISDCKKSKLNNRQSWEYDSYLQEKVKHDLLEEQQPSSHIEPRKEGNSTKEGKDKKKDNVKDKDKGKSKDKGKDKASSLEKAKAQAQEDHGDSKDGTGNHNINDDTANAKAGEEDNKNHAGGALNDGMASSSDGFDQAAGHPALNQEDETLGNNAVGNDPAASEKEDVKSEENVKEKRRKRKKDSNDRAKNKTDGGLVGDAKAQAQEIHGKGGEDEGEEEEPGRPQEGNESREENKRKEQQKEKKMNQKDKKKKKKKKGKDGGGGGQKKSKKKKKKKESDKTGKGGSQQVAAAKFESMRNVGKGARP